MFARVVKVSGENNGIQSTKVKPSRTPEARRKRKRARRILTEDGLTGSEPTVNVVCRSCGGHVVTYAHPGRLWNVVREVAPLARVGDFDGVLSRLDEMDSGSLSTGDFSIGLPRGLWVRSYGEVLAGSYTGRWNSKQPYHKRNGGVGVDDCVLGLPVVIEHTCKERDNLKPRVRRIEFEVIDLVAEVEQAIRDGKSKVAL